MNLLKSTSIFWFAAILLLSQQACKPSFSTIVKFGRVSAEDFKETLDFDINRGLIILPVNIKGETYRFLFDTGAPNSISKSLQKQLKFKTLSKGHIVDSEGNRSEVKYVGVDTIWLGNVPFIDQTAFVGDFEANPAIKCLNIDGIIGSNLMRLCNWKIDMKNQKMVFGKTTLHTAENYPQSLSFKTDKQYNLRVDLETGDATLTNLKIDYGSNGSLSVPDKVFQVLIDRNIIKQTSTISGQSQKGITGEINTSQRQTAYLDTLRFHTLAMQDVTILSGGSGLIGTDLLSKAVVIIDWSQQLLFFEEVDNSPIHESTFGFTVGLSESNTPYVQSVRENSSAHEQGIRPNMQVIRIDYMDFSKSHSYCDYFLGKIDKPSITVVLKDEKGVEKKVVVEKRPLHP
ncbi:MAG: hypothetical protein DWQ02_15665 [Bacteroidetes bacterium]|nr:MAG: hypothetical protein DWQ02_15665 [Bacteroidota bacterium]